MEAGVKKFFYTSGFGIDEALDNPLYRAKKDFEQALQAGGLPYVIVRPTGFFSDMLMILDMAKRGRVYLIGSGSGRINPSTCPISRISTTTTLGTRASSWKSAAPLPIPSKRSPRWPLQPWARSPGSPIYRPVLPTLRLVS